MTPEERSIIAGLRWLTYLARMIDQEIMAVQVVKGYTLYLN